MGKKKKGRRSPQQDTATIDDTADTEDCPPEVDAEGSADPAVPVVAVTSRVALKGHKGEVLCLDTSTPDINILASGGADSAVRIWDLRSNTTVRGIKAFGSDEVNSVRWGPKVSHQLFAAAGNKVYSFDLRKDGLVLDSAQHTFAANTDEINEIACHHNGKYLAACDDVGEVCIFDLQDNTLKKTLRGQHQNICSSVMFRPTKPWEVISGGLDSYLLFWDFSKGRVFRKVNLQETPEGASQLVNPRFIHSVGCSSDGRLLALGLGDGCVEVVSCTSGHSLASLSGEDAGHLASVGQVHFPNFGSSPQLSIPLLSGGNDKKVILWSLLREQEGDGFLKAHVTCLIDHPSKINWLSSSHHDGVAKIIVADQTHEISIYSVGT